jgi:hypothetical protein
MAIKKREAKKLTPHLSTLQNGPRLKRELKDAANGPPDFSMNPVRHANPPVPAAATTLQVGQRGACHVFFLWLTVQADCQVEEVARTTSRWPGLLQ